MTDSVAANIKIIQAQGWFNRTDPRVKLLFLVVYTFLNLLFLEPLALLALTLVLVPLYLTTRTNYRLLGTILLGYSIFIGAIVISQGMAPVGRMFADTEELHYVFDWGFAHMTVEGLSVGVFRSFRFANPFLYAILVAMSTDPVVMARGMIKLGLPFEIAFMMLAGIRFLPLAAEEARNISDAQTIRGVRGWFNRFRKMLFPLFLNSLRRAQIMGVTIEAKSWGAKNWKEFLRDVKITQVDAILASYGLALLLVSLYLRFVVGWGRGSGAMNPF
jgi:energy-coupling factor transport system permease protein